MSVSVMYDKSRDRAVMFDNTTGAAIGYTYMGVYDAEKELNEFVQWLDKDPRKYDESNLPNLIETYQEETGLLE